MMMSSNVLFCPTNTTKQNDMSYAAISDYGNEDLFRFIKQGAETELLLSTMTEWIFSGKQIEKKSRKVKYITELK